MLSAARVSKFFFAAFLIAGLFIFDDYGLSWDEDLNRIGTALPEYNYVVHNNKQALLESSEKYHGPSFELLLLTSERLSGFHDSRSIYLLRHFITFFFFWLSAIFLYRFCRKIFTGKWMPLLCVMMYVLSPRLFAESFYNSKDIGFLSFFTISIYTLQRFLEKKNISSAFVHALITGFMIDIRITGLIMPLVTMAVWGFDFFLKKKKPAIKDGFVFCGYVVLQACTIVLFWPVLWIDPWYHLAEAFAQMRDYPWKGIMMFMGQLITPAELPWYYLPVWIFISIPVLYVLLFVFGSLLILFRLFTQFRSFYDGQKTVILSALLLLMPGVAVILFDSVIYDGWRHLYFVYGPIVIIAGFGAEQLFQMLSGLRMFRMLFSMLLVFQFAWIAGILVRDHPAQHVYFNVPARMIFSPVVQKFDADYWGLTYRQGLEQLLDRDTASVIHVRVENDPGVLNVEILEPSQRERIRLHENLCQCDYWLAEFRGRHIDADKVNAQVFFQVNNSSGNLLTVYKGMKDETLREEIFHSHLSFEEQQANTVSSTAAKGNYSLELNSNRESGEPLYFYADSLTENELIELEVEAMVNVRQENPLLALVVSVMRGDSSVYWRAIHFQYKLNITGRWSKIRWNATLPEHLIMKGDKISTRLWSVKKEPVYIDEYDMKAIRFKCRKKEFFPK